MIQITETDRENRRKRARKMGKAPKTQKQRQASREHFRKLGKLPKTKKQLAIRVFGDDIVKHHNDLCHGKLRPDDVTYMRGRDHNRLHINLMIQNGTHSIKNAKRDIKGRFSKR